MGVVRRHPLATRVTVETMLGETTLSMKAIAAETGVPYETIRDWNRQMPVRARVHSRYTAPSLAALNLALRAHIGRQISAFDRRLRDHDPNLDSGKVLRDLIGLKRMLDDLVADAGRATREGRGRTIGNEFDGDADGGSRQDLAALRADLARRYAAFEAAWDRGEVPDDAASGPAEAAGG